ncbi:MAG: acyl-CoA dehydrogenase family protein [Vicinamibacterales bacterium]
MDFTLTDVQRAWRDKAASLGQELAGDATAADVVMGAARVGLLDPVADLLAVTVAVEALASESPAAAVAFGLHSAAALSVAGDDRFTALFRGEAVGALTLATDAIPEHQGDVLVGRASWVAPVTDHGVALIGVRHGHSLAACAVALDHPSIAIDIVRTAALPGLLCGHLTLARTPCQTLGATQPVMRRARVLLAATGLGLARRAVREALGSARGTSRGAGGEQTVQGLVADAATDLDAAMLLTWKAATTDESLSAASMAKLAATQAAQRAVERATQVVGADSFRRGHIIERLAQDVRALELFGGRTEALREAVAEAELPQGATS